MALFHNMVDVSLYNAYVLWISVDPSWEQQKSHRRRLYIEEVGESLVKPHMIKRGRLPRTPAAAEMVTAERAAAAGPSVSTESSRDRKQCEFCCDRRRRIGNTCYKCGRFICRDHSQFICGLCSS